MGDGERVPSALGVHEPEAFISFEVLGEGELCFVAVMVGCWVADDRLDLIGIVMKKLIDQLLFVAELKIDRQGKKSAAVAGKVVGAEAVF